MLYNKCGVTWVLLLCGVIYGGFCNTLSERNDGDFSENEVKERLSNLEEEFKSLKVDVKSINDALLKLLSVLQGEAPKEVHDVKKRAVVSVGDGLSGLPDALLDKIGQAGGNVYTRWGKTECGAESTLLYTGYTGGSLFNEPGGGVNYQCMPMDPQYSRFDSGNWEGSWITGVEYQTVFSEGVFTKSTHDQNAPCARCYTNNRPAVMMIPGKRNCSDGWTKEYEGFLMTDRNAHNHQTTFECVDQSPEYINGQGANTNGGLFYFVKAYCGSGGHCPPYDQKKELTCVVCSK